MYTDKTAKTSAESDRSHQDTEGGYQSGITALFINGVGYIDRWNIKQLKVAIATASH